MRAELSVIVVLPEGLLVATSFEGSRCLGMGGRHCRIAAWGLEVIIEHGVGFYLTAMRRLSRGCNPCLHRQWFHATHESSSSGRHTSCAAEIPAHARWLASQHTIQVLHKRYHEAQRLEHAPGYLFGPVVWDS